MSELLDNKKSKTEIRCSLCGGDCAGLFYIPEGPICGRCAGDMKWTWRDAYTRRSNTDAARHDFSA